MAACRTEDDQGDPLILLKQQIPSLSIILRIPAFSFFIILEGASTAVSSTHIYRPFFFLL